MYANEEAICHARRIKQSLRQAFPAVKFTTRCSGKDIKIKWPEESLAQTDVFDHIAGAKLATVSNRFMHPRLQYDGGPNWGCYIDLHPQSAEHRARSDELHARGRAQVAKRTAIKRALRQAFPGTRFCYREGWQVTWDDGPTVEEARAVLPAEYRNIQLHQFRDPFAGFRAAE
jgi:hypothetical protein